MTKRRRATHFNPDDFDLARKFCMLGATDDELARLLEVARETIDTWLAEVAEFAAAVKAGCCTPFPGAGPARRWAVKRARRIGSATPSSDGARAS